MSFIKLGAFAVRVWPAIVGACGAVYFAANRQYDQALSVLVGGLGLGQLLHASTRPTSPPPAVPA